MIKLNLSVLKFSRPKPPAPKVLPPQFMQALVEAAAWCSLPSVDDVHLRSPELDPSAFLHIPCFDEIGMQPWLAAKSSAYLNAVAAINRKRAEALLGQVNGLSAFEDVKARGKLLLYEPMETVDCGAACASSHGFFDFHDAPPWDTWFGYLNGSIFSWVPERLTYEAQAGIDANPVDCIHWSAWSNWSFSR